MASFAAHAARKSMNLALICDLHSCTVLPGHASVAKRLNIYSKVHRKNPHMYINVYMGRILLVFVRAINEFMYFTCERAYVGEIFKYKTSRVNCLVVVDFYIYELEVLSQRISYLKSKTCAIQRNEPDQLNVWV